MIASWNDSNQHPPSVRTFYSGAVFAATADPLNQNPVTETYTNWAGHAGGPGVCAAPDAADAVSNFRSAHTGGGQFLMCDGSVHFVSENIDTTISQGLSTLAGGEIVSVQ